MSEPALGPTASQGYGIPPVPTAQQPYGYVPMVPNRPGPTPGYATPTVQKRRGPYVAALAVVLVLVLGGLIIGFLVHQANEARKQREAEAFAVAEQTYAKSSEALDAALIDLETAQATLATNQADATTVVDSASTLLTSSVDGYVSADAKTTFDTNRATLQTAIDSWSPPTEPVPAAADPLPAAGDDVPAATEEALAKSAAIDADTRAVDDLTTVYDAQTTALQDAVKAVFDTANDLLATVPTTSQGFLDANPIATNKTKVALELAALDVSPTWSETSSTELDTFVAAAQAVGTSQAERTELLAHPRHPNRAKVEEFALSLAGGVPIDFEWAPIVNGFGTNGTSGGTSTFSTNGYEYSYSEMSLSNNIAEEWPDFSMQALVAHETGHSISGKPECYAMMNAAPFNGDIEVFATAWAIGQGFDDHNGSGEWLYGRPTDEQINVSKGCR